MKSFNSLMLLIFSILMISCQTDELLENKIEPVKYTHRITGTTYYINPNGNDANDGLSEFTAWRNSTKLNSFQLHGGDAVLFESGHTYYGNVSLLGNAFSDPNNPVFISYYEGVNPSKPSLVSVKNTPVITIRDYPGLIVSGFQLYGNGASRSGINLQVTGGQTQQVRNVTVRDLRIADFSEHGIIISSTGTYGFDNLLVEDTEIGNVAGDGLISYSDVYPYLNHTNMTFRRVNSHHNPGNGLGDKHSGSGIIMSGVTNGLIDDCKASFNGANNQHGGGGPMGIWTYNADHVIIQHSESFNNYQSSDADGGGFDIDGGATNCKIQYCYSHDNEGEGYLMAQYDGATRPFENNEIRFNLSYNDGNKANLGAFAIWHAPNYEMKNCYIYNNSAYGQNVGFNIMSGNVDNFWIANNLMWSNQTAFQGSTVPFTLRNNYDGQVVWLNQFRLPSNSVFGTAGIVMPIPTGGKDYYQRPLPAAQPVGATLPE
jgi:hypothetical protein